MIKFRIYILPILICFTSCTKESEKKKDNILYQNFEESINVSSVRYLNPPIPYEDYSFEYPTPSSGSAYYDLDIDGDKLNDYRINVTHSRPICTRTPRYRYIVKISGLNQNNLISEAHYPQSPKYYNMNDAITHDDYWVNEEYIFMKGGCNDPILDMKDSYIGIKLQSKYGWINIGPTETYGIELKEYAINLTTNNSIKAGQKE